MRFMLQVRADPDTEAGVMPSKELVAAMARFNEEMANAGVMQAAEGLHPSSKGARVSFDDGKPRVIEPPFASPQELIAGFWVIEVASKAEAIAWVVRAPFGGGVVEIRQIFEPSDFPAEVMPAEEAAREEALRAQLDRRR